MRFSLLPTLFALTSLLPSSSAERLIRSTSLSTCQDVSNLTASLFDVVFTPDNATLSFDVIGVTSITGNVTFGVEVLAYGYSLVKKTINPCDLNLGGLCPMRTGQFDMNSNINFTTADIQQIPSYAYGIPDLDLLVRVHINNTLTPDVSAACVETRLSNGQTVDQKGVSWATAVVAGLGLTVSAIISGLGHSNTAAHIASYALALFTYFQAVAIVGLVATPMPPIVQSWTQNFQWTMGIIEVDFMQVIATWYQKATGGTPASLFNTLTTASVEVQKRSLQALEVASGVLQKRTNTQSASGTYIVTGIGRVAFRAGMESTNLFLTGLIFFCIFIVLTVIAVASFKGFCEMAIRAKWMKNDKFEEFRNGWLVVLKGVMYRIILIGYPQITILCLWEFTQIDSPAEVVLAIFFFFGMSFTLGWAAWKVIRLAKHSTQMHKNPAYVLYSDPAALNKWGFLYVQFRATAYYYIVPILAYIIVKGMFIAFAQKNGAVQAVALIIIEAVVLIGASVMRPMMDKMTNGVNIAICVINFLNAIFLLFFSNIFNQPPLATGIIGVVFFLFNAVFALFLLGLVIVASVLSIVRKNPDTRYQPMTDDRASFIKSQTQLNTELDALGATARGDMKGHYKPGLDLDDDDNDSWSSDSMRRQNAAAMPLPASSTNSREPPHSPIDPSVPLFPAGQRNGPPSYADQNRVYQGAYGAESRHNSDLPLISNNAHTGSPGPYGRAGSSQSGFRQAHNASPMGYRNQNTASPWQRGAGYDH